MSVLKNVIGKIEGALNKGPVDSADVDLSEFQKRKIMHEYHVFYDRNKDGTLQWKDFEEAKNHILKLNGWKPESPKYNHTHDLFVELWKNLQDTADENCDGTVTAEEWTGMWKAIYLAKLKVEEAKAKEKPAIKKTNCSKNEDVYDGGDIAYLYVPEWFERYIIYKFNLYDRMGDGVIDAEEFEYTLCDGFNMPLKECRAAFTMFSEGGQRKIDFPYFRQLALEYYLSADSGSLGNFINGKLSYDN